MSISIRNKNHVLIIPEDDANRQLANGFILHDDVDTRRIHIEPAAGGWARVLRTFNDDHVKGMLNFPNRHVVLLIDFDGQEDRLGSVRNQIPTHLRDRVFVLGSQTEPESLKMELRCNLEMIGRRLASDCGDDTDHNWAHPLLQHNIGELARLRDSVRPFLFPNE